MNYLNLTFKDINILSNKRNWNILKKLYNSQTTSYVCYNEIINSSIRNIKDLKECLQELKSEGYIIEVPRRDGGKFLVLTIWGLNSFAIAENLLNH